MSFKDRLEKAAWHAKVPWGQTAIAKSLGVRKQTVDRWFDTGEPKPAQIFVIADKWKVDARWLATGEGQMLHTGEPAKLDPAEAQLLKDYRNASDSWKLTVRLLARTPPRDQPQLTRDMNILMTTIFGKAADDAHVAKAIGPLPSKGERERKK